MLTISWQYSQPSGLHKYKFSASSVQAWASNSPFAFALTQGFLLIPTLRLLFLICEARSALFISSGFIVESSLVNSAFDTKTVEPLECFGEAPAVRHSGKGAMETWALSSPRSCKKKFITLALIKGLKQASPPGQLHNKRQKAVFLEVLYGAKCWFRLLCDLASRTSYRHAGIKSSSVMRLKSAFITFTPRGEAENWISCLKAGGGPLLYKVFQTHRSLWLWQLHSSALVNWDKPKGLRKPIPKRLGVSTLIFPGHLKLPVYWETLPDIVIWWVSNGKGGRMRAHQVLDLCSALILTTLTLEKLYSRRSADPHILVSD